MTLFKRIKDILAVAGGYFPCILPLIAYLGLNNFQLALLLALDYILINPTLKRLTNFLGLQSKRPVCISLAEGYECFGMPSRHTEIHWILLSYLLLKWHYHNNESPSTFKHKIILYLVIIMTGIVMWQRIYTGRHTPFQVFIGAIIGSLIGYLFFRFESQNNLSNRTLG